MPWNERAPQDRATAQLIIAGGIMALAVGVWVIAAALLGGDPWEPTKGGIPAILLGPVLVAFGVGVVWRGIKMHRSDKGPRR